MPKTAASRYLHPVQPRSGYTFLTHTSLICALCLAGISIQNVLCFLFQDSFSKKTTIFKQDAQYTISKNNPEVLISETDFPESLISCAGAVLGLLLLLQRQAGIFYDDSLSVNVNTNHLLLLGRTGPAAAAAVFQRGSTTHCCQLSLLCARAGSGWCHQTSTAAGPKVSPPCQRCPASRGSWWALVNAQQQGVQSVLYPK